MAPSVMGAMIKSMKELPKTYDPAAYEDAVYSRWEKSGAFQPASDHDKAALSRKPYTIVMPPPNATGILHLGHALERGLQDALIRYHRMKGFDTLYLPGTDHAAIATASVVDRQLAKEGIDKQELGRKAFAERAKQYALKNKHIIESQNKALGASLDWTRNAFTMDGPREKAVVEAFRRLYKKGLIYRGSYMVNWCPHCRSVLADDEVEHKEQEGVLYHMKYGPFVLATTRPETKVGDTAVAVHPADKRYRQYVGQTVEVQTINGPRKLSVIADKMVDPEFGTGVVKITPFHDRNDYEVYQRHPNEAGPPIEVIGEDGAMTETAGSELAGLDRFEARKKMVAWLKKNELLVKEELHRHSVGHCYRCDSVIEPRISEQWFVKVTDLKKQAVKFVETGDLKFVPKRFTKTFIDWMDKLHDWCISRQIWFGHPVPAYLNDKGEVSLDPKPGFKPSQDTLDTWFSSALWPFSTLGWPDETPDLKRFFPNDVLEYGYDIIFFWVARMVLMDIALEPRGRNKSLAPPFHTAFSHGMVRDERGRKFSKSLGNTLDPLELIGKYGADALRFALTRMNTPGTDMNLDTRRIVDSRNFANKLWNIARYVTSLEGTEAETKLENLNSETLTTFDRAILHKLKATADAVEGAFYDETDYDKDGAEPVPPVLPKGRPYDLAAAGNTLYEFIWSEFADWYVEAAKVQLEDIEQSENTLIILRYVLENSLKLLHPFMPYITEVLWQEAFGHKQMLIVSAWPELPQNLLQPEDVTRYETVKEVVNTIRRLRTENNTPASARINATLHAEEPDWVSETSAVIKQLARLNELSVTDQPVKMPDSVVSSATSGITVLLPKAGLVDDKAAQKRLQGEIEQATLEVARLTDRLANKDYANKAPKHVVAQTKDSLKQAKQRLKKLEVQARG